MASGETVVVRVDNKVLKMGEDLIIVVANISSVRSSVPRPAFPIISVVLVLLGLVVSGMRGFGSIGWIVFFVGIALIAYWGARVWAAPKGVSIRTNAGTSYTVSFDNRAEADALCEEIEAAMMDVATGRVFHLENARIIDSPIGNAGGSFNYGG